MSDVVDNTQAQPRAPEGRREPTFDPAGEYAKLMRDRSRDSEAALAAERAARVEAERRLAEADAATSEKVKLAEKAGQEMAIRAELRVTAKAAGLLDMDVLRLIDLESAGVKLDRTGEVVGAAEAVAALREAKPWAFRQTAADQGSTSSQATAPTDARGGKKVADMDEAEYKAAKAALIKRR